jgi:hypothetical protein
VTPPRKRQAPAKPAARARAAPAKASKASKAAPPAKNGHGGKRAGAGRKRSGLPAELLERLGPPPADPLDTPGWYRRLLDEVELGVLRGEAWRELLRDLQKTAKISRDMALGEIQAELARLRLRPKAGEADAAGAVPTPRKDDGLAPRGAG